MLPCLLRKNHNGLFFLTFLLVGTLSPLLSGIAFIFISDTMFIFREFSGYPHYMKPFQRPIEFHNK